MTTDPADRIRHYVRSRSGFADTVIYYHGTSDKFLRQILKQGLLASPPQRHYQAKDMTRDFGRSMETYGGVYLSRDLGRAYSYAGDAARKFGGSSLIVACRVQERAALPDEDDFLFMTHLYFSGGLIEAETNYELMSSYYVAIFLGTPDGEAAVDFNFDRIIRHLERHHPGFTETMTKRRDRGVLRDLVRAIMLAEIRRRFRYYLDHGGGRLFYRIDYDIKYGAKLPDPNKDETSEQWRKRVAFSAYRWLYEIPDRSQAERDVRQVMDRFIKMVKNLTVPPPPSVSGQRPHHKVDHNTIRVDRDITYRGSTRIEAVFSVKNFKRYRDQIYLYYGSLPENVISDYNKMTGSTVEKVVRARPDGGVT